MGLLRKLKLKIGKKGAFLNYKDKDAAQKQLWRDNIYVKRIKVTRQQILGSNHLNKQKRFGSPESLQSLCIRKLWYQGSTTQHKFSLIEFQMLHQNGSSNRTF